MASKGKWSLLSGFLVEEGHCLSSKVGSGSAAGWAMLLDGSVGWVPCFTGASEWSSWSGEAPDCVPLLGRALAGLSRHP